VNGLVALLGSLARGDFHPLSDADTAVLDAGEDWAEAERAAHEAAEAFGVEADVSFWEELFGRVRAEALRDGVACG
jgi:predicted nucleotidyltransferase